jgi:hypothetical protein
MIDGGRADLANSSASVAEAQAAEIDIFSPPRYSGIYPSSTVAYRVRLSEVLTSVRADSATREIRVG